MVREPHTSASPCCSSLRLLQPPLYRSSNWPTDVVLPLCRTKQEPLALLPVDASNRLHHLHVRWFCTVCHRLFVLEDRCESSHQLSELYQYTNHQRTGENARITLCQLIADPLRNLADDSVMTDTISIQGKWNMRGKLRGDPIAEW
jgi:hypothetical protein